MTSNFHTTKAKFFTEVQKEKFEIQTISQMVANITAVVGKVSYDLSLKRCKLISFL